MLPSSTGFRSEFRVVRVFRSLNFFAGRLFAEAGEDGLEVVPAGGLLARIAQEVGGVEGEHHGDAFEFAPGAARLADGHGFVDESAGGRGAEAHDQLGLDDGDLPLEVGNAAGHLFGRGHAVAGGGGI